jgi:hypothetical protein
MIAMPQGVFVYFNSTQFIEFHGTHGCSGVVLSQEAGAEATRHVTAPELLCVRRRELMPRDT